MVAKGVFELVWFSMNEFVTFEYTIEQKIDYVSMSYSIKLHTCHKIASELKKKK